MKIGLFLPVYYEGGSFRIAKIYAKLLKNYSDKFGLNLQIVFGNTDSRYDLDTDLGDLVDMGIEIRHLEMKRFTAQEGLEYCELLGLKKENLRSYKGDYVVPFDGGNGYLDCDFWLFMVDRLDGAVLPFRAFGIFATDFIQRYIPDIFDSGLYANPIFLNTIYRNFRNADVAFASSPGTAEDLLSYVGRKKEITLLDPLYDDSFIEKFVSGPREPQGDYFVWVTNGSIHKNHIRAVKALELYYSKFGGKLKCVMTGVHTHFFDPEIDRGIYNQMHPYHRLVNDAIARSENVRKNLLIKGNVSDREYQEVVSGARFLWHNVITDNGTFSVIEAARMGVRALSSRYPQQEHIDRSFSLNMKFFDPFDIKDAAAALSDMEKDLTPYVPPFEKLKNYSYHGACEVVGAKVYSSILKSIQLRDYADFIP
nr:hypothetical protein BdHM001_14220 [Bdellovibrio sp. HM001]